MSIFRRRREPLFSEVPQRGLDAQETETLEQSFDEPTTIEQVVESMGRELELFANSRRETKECLSEACSEEMQTRWRMDGLSSATNSGLLPKSPTNRAEKRALNIRRNEKIWIGRINIASKIARMKVCIEEANMAGNFILADTVNTDVPTPATLIRTYTDRLYNTFFEGGSSAQFYLEKENEVFTELVANYTAEEHARGEVVSTLLTYLDGNLKRWEDFSLWIKEQSVPNLRHLHRAEQTFLRILSEDIHDPERGLIKTAHAELIKTNDEDLFTQFIGESESNANPSLRQRHVYEVLHFAEGILKTRRDDPMYVRELLAIKDTWPQELAAEFSQYSAQVTDKILRDIASSLLSYDSKQIGYIPTAEQVDSLLRGLIDFNEGRTPRLSRSVVDSVDQFAQAVAEVEPKRTFNFYVGSPQGEAEILTNERQEDMCLRLASELGEGEKFIADLRKIMAAVRDNPFEKGWEKIKEAGRMTFRTPAGEMTSALYRVNVAHRRGLSTSTRRAKDIRILFAQSGGDVVIISLNTHDSYDALIKRLR